MDHKDENDGGDYGLKEERGGWILGWYRVKLDKFTIHVEDILLSIYTTKNIENNEKDNLEHIATKNIENNGKYIPDLKDIWDRSLVQMLPTRSKPCNKV